MRRSHRRRRNPSQVRRAMPKPDPSLAPHLEDARVVVVCGAGGVGKTSVSAAIALHRAASGTETALLTVDPARRLATALRLPMLAGERAEVPVGGGRTLQAMQLDTQGRFVVPEDQRTHATISREVKVLGQHHRIEIWDADRFASVEGAKSADDVSAEIRRLRVF